MLEEWKVVQTKIDKIGEFRFHVKNWAVTVAVAFIVGAYVTNAPPYLIFAALVPTWAFFLVENRQEKILYVLMTRAERLERAMERLATSLRTVAEWQSLTVLLGAVGSVPGVAGALRTFARSRKFHRWIFNEINFYIAVSIFIVFVAAGDFWRMATIAKTHAQSTNQFRHLETKVAFPEAVDRDLERLSLSSERSSQELTYLRRLMSPPDMSLVDPSGHSVGKSYRTNGSPMHDDSLDILFTDYVHLYLNGTRRIEPYSGDRSQ
jgi:hypothetical protein